MTGAQYKCIRLIERQGGTPTAKRLKAAIRGRATLAAHQAAIDEREAFWEAHTGLLTARRSDQPRLGPAYWWKTYMEALNAS